jgi:hypothetical protein
MSDENGIYNLNYCVQSVLADLDETSSRHYQKFLHYAIQGYRRLNLGNLTTTNIKTAVLEVDSNTKTACLPNDYVNFLKIGYSCHGTIINLDYSDELRFQISDDMFPAACDCQDELNQCQQLVSQGVDVSAYPFYSDFWYYNSYWNSGQFKAGYYGQGAGKYRNAYRINKEKWEIQFDSYIKADFVVMEYLSNGIECGESVIDETLIPAITAFIHWKRCLHDSGINRLEAQMWERQWMKEVRGVAARQSAMTAYDWVNKYRHTLKQTPKR